MPSASSVVDHFEAAALKDEFDAAVEHLTQLTMASTTLDGPELTEAVERRLFSLHARVTRGHGEPRRALAVDRHRCCKDFCHNLDPRKNVFRAHTIC